jgi:hypothetical protein
MATHPGIINRTQIELGRTYPAHFALVGRDQDSHQRCLIFVSDGLVYMLRWDGSRMILKYFGPNAARRYRINETTRIASINFGQVGSQLRAVMSHGVLPQAALDIIYSDLTGRKRGTAAISHLSSPHFCGTWAQSEGAILQVIASSYE